MPVSVYRQRLILLAGSFLEALFLLHGINRGIRDTEHVADFEWSRARTPEIGTILIPDFQQPTVGNMLSLASATIDAMQQQQGLKR